MEPKHKAMSSYNLGVPRLLPLTAIKPRGWIKEQMLLDLHDGLKGNFPAITPNVGRRLFAKQERVPGTWVAGARHHKEKAWWAGEHEAYWIDSIARSAIMLDSPEYLKIVHEWVADVLDAYGRTGYIGIYAKEARFPDRGFDGELWTQSRAFQALLAWFEYSGEQRVLDAVESTVRQTIDHYSRTTYFGRLGADGGVTHGVGYMDTLEWLHRLTGDRYYAESAVWLYRDYSENAPDTFRDLAQNRMADADLPWFDHGAHVGEALHMPRIAAHFSGSPETSAAADNVIPKLQRHTNPGGGMSIGFLEAVAGSRGGGHVLNENCAHVEALMSLNTLFQYEPDPTIGDWKDRCAFNVLQGARLHPADRAVIYLSRDNRLRADNPDAHGGRELFSACHEAAACCVLNVPRTMPYFVHGQWYQLADRLGILANGFAPCEIRTRLANVPAIITVAGEYPFEDQVVISLTLERPIAFDLLLRIPAWTNDQTVEVPPGIDRHVEQNFIICRGTWRNGDVVTYNLGHRVERNIDPCRGEAYYTWGPLCFALPFKAKETVHATIDGNPDQPSGFAEYLYAPEDDEGWRYLAVPGNLFRLVSDGDRAQYPFATPPIALEGELATRDGEPRTVRLVPMGSAALRRTTFPLSKLVPSDGPAEAAFGPDEDPMRAF